MRILISPYSRQLRNGNLNPKNYPDWNKLVTLLNSSGVTTVQLGISGEQNINCHQQACDLAVPDIKRQLDLCDTWIAVDNFFGHFAHYHKKPGIVIWGKSDPNIFGYPENLNILKDRNCLRKDQFALWDSEPYDPTVFLSAEQVFYKIQERYELLSVMAFDLL